MFAGCCLSQLLLYNISVIFHSTCQVGSGESCKSVRLRLKCADHVHAMQWLLHVCRYDKVKILLKEIQSCQYVACMNPTAGSFNITPRMQRHFATFAVQMPPPDIVRSIYLQILDGHLTSGGFDTDVTKMATKLVDATIELHRLVRHTATEYDTVVVVSEVGHVHDDSQCGMRRYKLLFISENADHMVCHVMCAGHA